MNDRGECDGCDALLAYRGIKMGSNSVCESCYERALEAVGI